MSYERFASVYDILMEDVPYDRWIALFVEEMGKTGMVGKKVLDVACGTGEFTIRLAQRGFDVSGVDLSEDMLSIARDKAEQQKLNLPFYHQDMTELDTGEVYDGVVIFCDSLNYLRNEEETKKTFAAVYEHLHEGGLFLFDVHSVYKIHQIFADATFADAGEEVSYIWNSFLGEEPNSIEHELTFFVENDSGLYERFEEDHYQRTYPVEDYLGWLKQAGFSIKRLVGDLGDSEPGPTSERILFVAVKE
ncbi:class I SAM-dependent DNA methyltransferase [Bacillus testis]|uniref:class I SAM-dependent DNA methyltransferase n=1 Tax=Bacillus testis TaxID=1622072 RepID=UPI00067E8401|nr:class I SAM-dependent methyltransferase [Bacillus testis]